MNKRLRSSLMGVVTVMSLLMIMSCSKPGAKKEKIDYTAPAVSGMDINGKGVVSLKQLKGQVIFLNFWATWCPPCRAEIPDLIRLQKKYKQDFAVLGVSVDKDGIDGVRKFAKKIGINYSVIMANNHIVNAYGGIRNIPTSYLINRKGELVTKIVGARSYKELEAVILPYINQK